MVPAYETGVKEAGAYVHHPSAQANMTPAPTETSLRWRAWRLLRPVVRPAAWRLRLFFAGPLHDEVRELRMQVEALRAELRERAAREDAALEPRIAAVLEQALLTLALDREARRLPQSRQPLP